MGWEADFLRRRRLEWGSAAGPAAFDELDRSFWLDLWRAPIVEAVEDQGVEVRRYGPVQANVIAALREEPLMNLVLGAAEPEAAVGGHLAEALDWVESLGVDFRVPITPEREGAAAAEELLNQRGYQRSGYLARFLRRPGPLELAAPPGVDVIEMEELVEGFSDMLGEGYEMALTAHCFFDCLPGRLDWRCYMARDEREYPLGVAATMLHGSGVAQLGFAATPEAHRGRGAHLALLRRCILDTSASHWPTMFAETVEHSDDPDGPSPGARNLVRGGFKQATARPVWRPPYAKLD